MSNVKKIFNETSKLLWQFKWYIVPYILFYLHLLMSYFMPSKKNYCIWEYEEWYNFDLRIYVKVTELMLIIFLLLFLIGTSNMRNHPLIAKCIFLSSLWFLAVFLEII